MHCQWSDSGPIKMKQLLTLGEIELKKNSTSITGPLTKHCKYIFDYIYVCSTHKSLIVCVYNCVCCVISDFRKASRLERCIYFPPGSTIPEVRRICCNGMWFIYIHFRLIVIVMLPWSFLLASSLALIRGLNYFQNSSFHKCRFRDF